MSTCIGYCISEKIDINRLVIEYSGEIKKHRESVLIYLNGHEVFIFPYGVIVIWGNIQKEKIIEILENYLITPFDEKNTIVDEFMVKREESPVILKEDTIYLYEEDEYVKLSISHPIAQSLKLSQVEDEIIQSTNELINIPRDLAQTGKIKLSKTEISKRRGELHLLKATMSLNYSLLDKPEFFWEWPEYDHYYGKVADYLEFNQRTEILSKRMETIDELLSILVEELNHRHSSRLEWIIIWLILFEIIMFLGHDMFKLF